MSSAAVATIACLALVGAAGMAVWVALQQRRTDELARALTSHKWDIVTLRAELGALRHQLQGESPGSEDPAAHPGGDAAGRPVPPDAAGDGRAGDTRAGDTRAGDTRAGDTRTGDTRTGDGRAEGDGRGLAPRSRGGVSRATAAPVPSPTAWRRDRARGASARPRRRRLS